MKRKPKFASSPAVVGILLGVLFFIAIVNLSTRVVPLRLQSPSTTETASVAVPLGLHDETLARGIDFRHAQLSDSLQGLDDSLGSGACVFDMDNDNDLDLFMVGGSGQQRFYGKDAWWSKRNYSHLYRNDGEGYFEDVTEGSGLDIEFWGMGCNVADFDLDGLVDLLLTGRNQNLLFRNLGNSRFASQRLGTKQVWSTSAAIGDYNSDGLMDIYIANFLQYDKTARKFESASGFEVANPAFKAETYPGTANFLYTNKGGFEFRQDGGSLGIENAGGRSMAAKWLDANLDRWPDLLVLNASGSASKLFLNQEGLAFEEAPGDRIPGLPNGIRDGAFQDYDEDGDADLILSTILGENFAIMDNDGAAFRNLAWQEHGSSGDFSSFSGFGIGLADLNNDGHFDIFHGQGFLHPDPDAPAVSAGQPDAISVSTGDGAFQSFATASVITARWNLPYSTRSVITADIDNDGDRDLLLTSNNNASRLLINHAPNPRWIGIDLIDEYGNRGNYFRIRIESDLQSRVFFMDQDTFLGRRDDRISLVLDETEVVEKIQVTWRDNSETTITKPEINRYLKLQQGSGVIDTYNAVKSTLPPTLPAKLAIWQYRARRGERRRLVDSILQAKSEYQIEMMQAIATYQYAEKLPAFLFAALAGDDDEIVTAAIETLEALEIEESYYWLAPLFLSGSDEVQCALAQAFQHFYTEEEAFIHRKNLAIPHLIRLLDDPAPKVVTCAIHALAESKSVRAVAPIEKLLQVENFAVREAALYALGELRRAGSASLIQADSDESPQLVAAKQTALYKLNVSRPQNASIQAPEKSPQQTICPALTGLALPAQADDSLATKFAACEPQAIGQWFDTNRAYIMRNLSFFFDTLPLDEAAFTALIESLNSDNSIKTSQLFLLRLQKSESLAEKLVLVGAMKQRLPAPAIEKVLKQMMTSKKNAHPLRVAIGDVLIDHDADFVLQMTTELFDDNTVTK